MHTTRTFNSHTYRLAHHKSMRACRGRSTSKASSCHSHRAVLAAHNVCTPHERVEQLLRFPQWPTALRFGPGAVLTPVAHCPLHGRAHVALCLCRLRPRHEAGPQQVLKSRVSLLLGRRQPRLTTTACQGADTRQCQAMLRGRLVMHAMPCTHSGAQLWPAACSKRAVPDLALNGLRSQGSPAAPTTPPQPAHAAGCMDSGRTQRADAHTLRWGWATSQASQA
jgi:hypothetical protein